MKRFALPLPESGPESRPKGELEGQLFDAIYGREGLTSPYLATQIVNRVMAVLRERYGPGFGTIDAKPPEGSGQTQSTSEYCL